MNSPNTENRPYVESVTIITAKHIDHLKKSLLAVEELYGRVSQQEVQKLRAAHVNTPLPGRPLILKRYGLLMNIRFDLVSLIGMMSIGHQATVNGIAGRLILQSEGGDLIKQLAEIEMAIKELLTF